LLLRRSSRGKLVTLTLFLLTLVSISCPELYAYRCAEISAGANSEPAKVAQTVKALRDNYETNSIGVTVLFQSIVVLLELSTRPQGGVFFHMSTRHGVHRRISFILDGERLRGEQSILTVYSPSTLDFLPVPHTLCIVFGSASCASIIVDRRGVAEADDSS